TCEYSDISSFFTVFVGYFGDTGQCGTNSVRACSSTSYSAFGNSPIIGCIEKCGTFAHFDNLPCLTGLLHVVRNYVCAERFAVQCEFCYTVIPYIYEGTFFGSIIYAFDQRTSHVVKRSSAVEAVQVEVVVIDNGNTGSGSVIGRIFGSILLDFDCLES